MFTSSLTISFKGQITLPKKVRDILATNTVKLEITDDNKVVLLPIKNVGGSLSAYGDNNTLPFQQVREIAWKDAIENKLNNKGNNL
jgi:bifunctional DNA-binding transcriptional regulator/antitoxin component of YhaV-PrlF toxin-antitoxin module